MAIALETVAMQLGRDVQLLMIEEVRSIVRDAPLRVPLTRGGRPMRVKVSAAGELGWTADGTGYRYSSRQADGRPWPAIPKTWLDIADQVAGSQPWDSAILNWYPENGSLGFHQDKDEVDLTRPIVTLMVGDPCTWSVKEFERSKPTSCRLESGSVTLLAGITRNYFHAVTKIIADPLFSPLKTRGRISVTIRVAG
jgi:alkylated DNA repair protein (DNA oxidative demethylase)